MTNLTWNQFVKNVQHWAAERGIYEHSTATAQLLKALSELGEVADAVIKNDREALADGVGDVAVCLVNYMKMNDRHDLFHDVTGITFNQLPTSRLIGIASCLIGEALEEVDDKFFSKAMIFSLKAICQQENLDFMTCCTGAWEEIKDRKGRVVAGGAFVKDSE